VSIILKINSHYVCIRRLQASPTTNRERRCLVCQAGGNCVSAEQQDRHQKQQRKLVAQVMVATKPRPCDGQGLLLVGVLEALGATPAVLLRLPGPGSR
jgi:hypothetical protein